MNDRRDIRFAKMSGAGNDFIVLTGPLHGSDPGVLARELCQRRTSVGADGLILVEPGDAEESRVRVRFWNPDGEEVATCGNGTRCAARFAVLEGFAPEELTLETGAGEIRARVAGESVLLSYDRRPTIQLDVSVSGPRGPETGHRVEIGNPHLVIPLDALPAGPIEAMCAPLRRAPELGSAGANVHLVEVVDRHKIRIRSYERGVEAETLACGSGSISSAVALAAAERVDSPVTVETRSGDLLTIRFTSDGNGGFAQVELEGPARLVYRGSVET